MSVMTLPHKNGSKAVAPAEVWKTSTVQAFFTAINWEGNTPEVEEIRLVSSTQADSTVPLSLSLSVSQFFAAVNWSGEAIAAPVPLQQSPLPQAPADNLTLDDFSSLF